MTVSKQVQAAMASDGIVRQIWDKVNREPREITKAACDTMLIQVIGPKGCGKTTFVLDAMKRKNHVFYFSFENLSAQEALRLFSKRLSDFLRVESSTDWESAFAAIKRAYEINDPSTYYHKNHRSLLSCGTPELLPAKTIIQY